jgi:hypothetical protein
MVVFLKYSHLRGCVHTMLHSTDAVALRQRISREFSYLARLAELEQSKCGDVFAGGRWPQKEILMPQKD